MNKQRIIAIIVVAALTMLGLIGLQVHWVNNAFEIRNSSFEGSVNEALKQAVKNIEKQDLSHRLKNRFESVDNLSELLTTFDSLSRMEFHAYDTLNYPPGMNYNRLPGQSSFTQSQISTPNDFERSATEMRRLMKRSSLLSSLFMNMMGFERTLPIEKRINKKQVDSLIGVEMRKKGINTHYEFGVMAPPYQDFVTCSNPKFSKEIKNSGFSYDIFPNNIFREPVYLNVYFPQKRSYIFSRMSLMLVLAIILLSLLIFTFYYTIHTIIKQKKLSEMKNDFINNMTHEFKTPISTISLACQSLSDQDIPKDDQLYESYVHIINEENNRLGSMAEKILQTAIIDKGTLKLKTDVINMHEVINDAIDKIRMQVTQKNGTINTDLKATNPVVKADQFHMTNVIFNLLDNANKYSLNEPRIKVSTQNKPEGLQVEVRDNGIGISKTNQKKIFEKLYRVPTGNIHAVKGFGLGLSYVKAILDKHNGKIDIQSEPNRGSTFIIFIPFQTNHQSS